MRKIWVFSGITVILSLQACSSGISAGEHNFGASIDTSASIPIAGIMNAMGDQGSREVKVSGLVKQVCQSEGCWFKFDQGNGQELLVRTKDNEFSLPNNIAGKTAFVEGLAYYDTTSVEKLKEYAQEEGQSDAEVQAIVNPEVRLVIEAKGVVIR